MDKPGLHGEQPNSGNHERERRVAERTAELARTNERLRQEITSRRRAEQALQRRNRELQLLYQVSQKLGSSLELERVIGMVLNETRLLLSATGCTVWRPEPEKGRITCWQASGPDSALLSGLHIPYGEGLVGWTAQHSRELLVTDARADARHYKGVDAQIGVEIRSILCLPLQVQERLIAVLEVVSDKAAFFTEEDLALLRPLVASAAMAIDNARLYHQAHELRSFNENIVQHMREGIVLEDKSGQITFANPAAAEMLDCSIQDLIGRSWPSLIAPEHLEWIGVTGSGRRYETVLRTASERRLPAIVSSQPLSAAGRSRGRLTSFTDISDRKAADEALRSRNQELSLLNRLIAASVERQTVGEILGVVCRELAFAFHASHAAAALFDESQGQATIVAQYPSNSQPAAADATFSLVNQGSMRELIRTGMPLVLEPGDTGTAWPEALAPHGAASMLLLPLFVEGEPAGCLSLTRGAPYTFSPAQTELARPVAEQVSGSLTRARLNERQQRLSAAVEQAAEAVLIADATGSLLYVNPSFEEITGYSPSRIAGQDLAALDGELWEELAKGKTWHGRRLKRKQDGSQFLADETAAPVCNGAGEIVSYVITLRDVTHVVALEEQYYHAQKMEAVGRIAGGIAHDYKNLLTIIEMASGILALQMHPKDPQREHVAAIQGASRRARDLTQQLLRFSRREAANPEVLDLNRLIEDMGWLLQCLIDEDIKLQIRLSPEPAEVRIDLAQMEQVIMNLLINARDAMPEGGSLDIETSCVVLEARSGGDGAHGPGDYVLLNIADDGTGMDTEVKARLFEPFFTTKERGKGTGLGLPTVQSIVEQNGGHIEVDSELGQGTTFHIYLPQAAGDTPALLVTDPSQSEVPAGSDLRYRSAARHSPRVDLGEG